MRRNQGRREQQFVDPFQEAVWYVEFQGWSYESQDLLWLFTAYAWPSWPTDSISFDKCIMLRLRQALTKYMQIPLIFGTPIHFQHPNAGCNRLINSRPLRRILEIGAVQMASLLNDIPYFLHLSQETMVRNNGRTDGSAIHQIAVLTPAVRVSLDSSIRFVENTKTQSRIYN